MRKACLLEVRHRRVGGASTDPRKSPGTADITAMRGSWRRARPQWPRMSEDSQPRSELRGKVPYQKARKTTKMARPQALFTTGGGESGQ